MSTERSTVRHEICLVAMFLVGNALIGMPYQREGRQSLPGFLAAAVLGFLSLLVLIPLCRKLRPVNVRMVNGALPKILYILLLIITVLAALWSGWCCIRDFSAFVSQIMLSGSSRPVIALLFAALALLLAFVRKEALLKLSLLTFFGTAVCVLLLFLACAGQFNFKNLINRDGLQLPDIANSTLPFLKKSFGQLFVVIAYLCFTASSFSKKSPVGGLAAGGIILLLCLCNILLVFGENFASQLEFPYSYAISTITVGQLFSRMEGISYFIYFFCCLVKLAVSLATVKLAVKRFFPTDN